MTRSHFTSHLIEAIDYDKSARAVRVRFDDGDLAYATLDALRVPRGPLVDIKADEFKRGIEFYFEDGSMHDVSVDYFAWLASDDYEADQVEADELAAAIAANVARLRDERDLSQAKLAELAEMKAPNISRLEAGKSVPTLEVLIRVATALKVPPAMLMRVERKKARPARGPKR